MLWQKRERSPTFAYHIPGTTKTTGPFIKTENNGATSSQVPWHASCQDHPALESYKRISTEKSCGNTGYPTTLCIPHHSSTPVSPSQNKNKWFSPIYRREKRQSRLWNPISGSPFQSCPGRSYYTALLTHKAMKERRESPLPTAEPLLYGHRIQQRPLGPSLNRSTQPSSRLSLSTFFTQVNLNSVHPKEPPVSSSCPPQFRSESKVETPTTPLTYLEAKSSKQSEIARRRNYLLSNSLQLSQKTWVKDPEASGKQDLWTSDNTHPGNNLKAEQAS
jgi:hypothetical protein